MPIDRARVSNFRTQQSQQSPADLIKSGPKPPRRMNLQQCRQAVIDMIERRKGYHKNPDLDLLSDFDELLHIVHDLIDVTSSATDPRNYAPRDR